MIKNKASKKHQNKITSLNIYDTYFSDEQKAKISREDFKQIIEAMGEIIGNYIIDTGHRVLLPKRLGSLIVLKKKARVKIINFKATKESGELIRNNNYATDKQIATFKWVTKTPDALLKFGKMYKFYPVRWNKWALKDAIKNKNSMIKYYAVRDL